MNSPALFSPLLDELDRWQVAGRTARFWLRDDDAVAPTPALARLLRMAAAHGAPVTLAVIPQPSGEALADDLRAAALTEVAVHGFAHVNHAPPPEKKQELGAHRPPEIVLSELRQGFAKLQRLHGERFVPLLVPPWNRLSPVLVPALAGIGFRALSVFGPEKAAALPLFNTHVDLIDWHGTRGGRDGAALVAEILSRLSAMAETGGIMGFLTHHLDHDAAAWDFLDGLLAATAGHPACRWIGARVFTAR